MWFIVYAFILRFLCQQKVLTTLVSPISKLTQLLVALRNVDGTDLDVFNIGDDSTQCVVIKVQHLPNDWHTELKVTGRDLKHSKCYWTLQEHTWDKGRCIMNTDSFSNIKIATNSTIIHIVHVFPLKMRSLVGITITSSNSNEDMRLFKKITSNGRPLNATNSNPQGVLFDCERHCLPTLIFAASILTLNRRCYILALLHASLLPKLIIMKTFLLIIKNLP